jgi:hypothetical protein
MCSAGRATILSRVKGPQVLHRGAASRTFVALDLVITIETDDAALFDLLDEQLPPFPQIARDESSAVVYRIARAQHRRTFIVVRGHRTIAERPDLAATVDILVQDLQSTLAQKATAWTLVHAGVVAVNGRAWLLPGRSGAGKTTLVAALLRAGAAYGSDEFAVLDSDGQVHSYPRPLAIRTCGELTRVAPEAFGGTVFTGSKPVDAVLFTEFHPHQATELRALSPAQVALHLLPHCLGVRGRPTATLRRLRATTCGARGLAGLRGDADITARRLIDQMLAHS